MKNCKIHHLCSEDDIGYIVAEIKEKYPKAKIVAIGTSMGAGLMIKYAGKSRENCLFDAIAAVAPPVDYIHCRAKLHSWWPYLGYSDAYILKSQKIQLQSVMGELSGMEDELNQLNIRIEEVLESKSSMEFDEKFTIRITEHKNTEEYYKKASCEELLKDVKVPLLLLSARDDPVVQYKKVPLEKVEGNTKVIFASTRTGGHVGFFEGLVKPKRWYPKPCIEFFEAVIGMETGKKT
jgi:uncharacterized protein